MRYVITISFNNCFRDPGENGLSGAPGLPGNFPHVPLNNDGKCVPCPHGPPGKPGLKGNPGIKVSILTAT